MAVSSLREITLGVSNLMERTRQFEGGCGLQILTRGLPTSITAGRLFDLHLAPQVVLLSRPDVPGSPRLRLVEVVNGEAARTQGLRTPGPLGVGFTARRVAEAQARLQTLAVDFASLPPGFGRAEDGDVFVLSEGAGPSAAPEPGLDCSPPLHASFVVTNLDASLHFMRDALEQNALSTDRGSGPPFDALGVAAADGAFNFAVVSHPGPAGGRVAFMEFERRPAPMAQTPGLSRGLCRLRYDTTDLHATLERLPGGGGTLVRGPASVDDPVLGRGLVAMVRAPFGVLIELWQTS